MHATGVYVKNLPSFTRTLYCHGKFSATLMVRLFTCQSSVIRFVVVVYTGVNLGPPNGLYLQCQMMTCKKRLTKLAVLQNDFF